MDKKSFLIGAIGLGVGAGLMYMLDPDRGRRRRAIVRDKTVHLVNETEDRLEHAAAHLANRARGTFAEVKSRFSSEQVDDAVLVERVRAKLGRVTGDPHAITVTAVNGMVKLTGLVDEAEIAKITDGALSVRGVKEVENRLQARQQTPQELAKAAIARAATF